MKIALAQQMREMDRIAIEDRKISSTLLMEYAATALTREILRVVPAGEEPRRAVCFCGAGNNGGDGVATARFLLEAGFRVRAILVGSREKMSSDCQAMEALLLRAGGRLEPFCPEDPDLKDWCNTADVLVDALFGTGLHRPLREDAQAAVALMNGSPAPVFSADIASGVETDTGHILGAAVRAHTTVTFSLPKPGHYLGEGGLCAGNVVVATIHIPQDIIDDAESHLFSVTAGDVRLPRRRRDAHKGDFGKVYILGGCVGFSGAPVLAARAAVRSGAGLVTVGVPAPLWPVAAGKLDEAMPHPLPSDEAGMLTPEALPELLRRLSASHACLIGPGMGRSEGTGSLVRSLLRELTIPVVLDADGINALEGHMDVLEARRGRLTVLTPHDGEFARMGGDLSGGDRLASARSFAAQYGCCLVLKGHRTITALPDGTAFVNTTGNPGMATGGSGDVLGGILLALLGQGLPVEQAAPWAVWLHGRAGDLCAQDLGEYSLTPSDLIERLPAVIRDRTLTE